METAQIVTCLKCGGSRKRPEKFLDFGLFVKDTKGVEDSLKKLFEFEQMAGDNKIECETCNEKTDS
jgi:ubiquitin C-terminal hydrolase